MTVFVLMISLLISPNMSSQLSPLSHVIPHVSNFLSKLSKHTRAHTPPCLPWLQHLLQTGCFLIYTEINTHLSQNCSEISTIHGAQLQSAVYFTLTLHLKLEKFFSIHIFCKMSITQLPLHFDSLKKRSKVQNEPHCFNLIALAFIWAKRLC